MSILDAIVARTRREVLRRKPRPMPPLVPEDRRASVFEALRPGELLRQQGEPAKVIAEVKFRSPSAGEIRPKPPGEGIRVAKAYESAGAAAISVLADAPAFGGSPLEVRRVAQAVGVPVLFKGFVVDEIQLDLAHHLGASMVLLLARVLSDDDLHRLVEAAQSRGLVPLVEAADLEEVERSQKTGARLIGVNARDLHTFRVDPALAQRCLAAIDEERIAIYMSGLRSSDDYHKAGKTRADAVLVGEGLMRAPNPGKELQAWLRSKPFS